MPKITQLEVQKTNKDRINLYIDGEFYCGLSIDLAVAKNLVVGAELDRAALSEILADSGENDLYIRALGYILKGPRTEREITGYLYRKDASPETMTRIIERLKTMNYINDEAYAKMFTSQKSEKLGVGAIRNKLYLRGISSLLIENSMKELEEKGQDDLARNIAEKYLRHKDRGPKTMQKLYRYLGSKGFDFELCSQIVEEFKSNQDTIAPEKLEEYEDKWVEYKRARDEAKKHKAELKRLKKELLEGHE